MKARKEEVLVEETRGGLVENFHTGHICIVTQTGEIAYRVGNPEHVCYLRSSAKPMQALAFLALGLDKKYGLSDSECTILAGSHMGGDYHISALESIAGKMGIREDELILLPAYPANSAYRDSAVAAGKAPRKFYHNCAGKHLATIAMAREFHQDTHTYAQTGTPVQEYLLTFIAQITTFPKEKIAVGIDGCGVPVYGMPLHFMAKGFLRMGCPELLEQPGLADKARFLTRVMHENPRYINKEDYICTCMNEDPNVFAKGGAQGIYCFVLRDRKLGVAFKICDGSEEEWQLVIWEIMRQLGDTDTIAMKNMLRLRPFEIINATGATVGAYKPVFTLRPNEN